MNFKKVMVWLEKHISDAESRAALKSMQELVPNSTEKNQVMSFLLHLVFRHRVTKDLLLQHLSSMVLEVTKLQKVAKDSTFYLLLQCLYIHLFMEGSDDTSTLVWLDSIVDLCFLHTALRS